MTEIQDMWWVSMVKCDLCVILPWLSLNVSIWCHVGQLYSWCGTTCIDRKAGMWCEGYQVKYRKWMCHKYGHKSPLTVLLCCLPLSLLTIPWILRFHLPCSSKFLLFSSKSSDFQFAKRLCSKWALLFQSMYTSMFDCEGLSLKFSAKISLSALALRPCIANQMTISVCRWGYFHIISLDEMKEPRIPSSTAALTNMNRRK